ncbi:LCP family protein [Bacillus litorisediminis]|uniref:LCP family protein n=1 Tax=Bacillus litorisediminis TaxID=2922713 RepID=UPI001FABFC24|nr:LCP family protein [Bacillus litorisediminis]
MFKLISGFLLIIGSLLVGCILWWSNQTDVSDPQQEQEKYWNPIEEVPKLPEFLSKEKEGLSSDENENSTFLLMAEQNDQKTISLPVVFVEVNPETNDIKMSTIAINDLVEKNLVTEADQAEIKTKAEEHFDTMIDHMITVNTEGFAKLVNDIVPEGINVTITEEMVNESRINQEPGTYTLTGEDLFSNEFGLVLMEPEVISAITDSITSNLEGLDGMIKIPSLLKESQEYVNTNMDFTKLVSLVSELAADAEKVEVENIPVQSETNFDTEMDEQQIDAYQPEMNSFYRAGL